MELGLRGRHAVVTGASEGIGRSIALGLAAEGVNVALLARGEDGLRAVAAEAVALDDSIETIVLSTDLRDPAAVDAAAREVAQRFGRVEIVVNNAGNRMRPGRQIEWSDEEWMRDVDTKLFGALRVVRAFEAQIAADGSGRIIFVSGVAGSMVWDTAMTHGINNSALNHLTRYLATDLAPRGITVNSLIPGLIATEWRHAWAEGAAKQAFISKAEFLERVYRQKGVLLGRWAEPAEIADAAVFLASARAGYITGTALLVDGGLIANARVS